MTDRQSTRYPGAVCDILPCMVTSVLAVIQDLHLKEDYPKLGKTKGLVLDAIKRDGPANHKYPLTINLLLIQSSDVPQHVQPSDQDDEDAPPHEPICML